jgi:ribosome-binding protein aMBF1 (putative translation factor)
LQRVESGKLAPSPSVAQKIERRLGVDLRDKNGRAASPQLKKAASGPVTLGDIVVVRKKT